MSAVGARAKKDRARQRARPQNILKRRQARTARQGFDAQIDLDPDQLVIVDDALAKTKMARRHRRCRRGARLRMGCAHGHRKTTTLVAGLRLSGIAAPMALERPINRSAFTPRVPGDHGRRAHQIWGRVST
jgi:hypothetical protein